MFICEFVSIGNDSLLIIGSVSNFWSNIEVIKDPGANDLEYDDAISGLAFVYCLTLLKKFDVDANAGWIVVFGY